MKTLNVIDATSPEHHEAALRGLLNHAVWADRWGNVFVFYHEGLTEDQVYRLVEKAPFKTPHFYSTRYPAMVTMALHEAKRKEKRVHLIIGKPVCYEPTASVFNFAGLTIPAVFEEELGSMLAAADTVTICVKSHE